MYEFINVAAVFTDNMVIQRNVRIPVWGRASDGLRIQVELNSILLETTASNGGWHVVFPAMQEGGPYSLKITSTAGVIVLSDLLVGEVWVAGGQSNMEMPLVHCDSGMEEIPKANNPQIRFYTVPRRPYENALVHGWHFYHTVSVDSQWKVCTPYNARYFSGVAYHFAKELHKALNIPIGIIECNWGGTSAAAWTDTRYLLEDEELKTYVLEYEKQLKDINSECYEEAYEKSQKGMRKFAEHMIKIPLEQYERIPAEMEITWPPYGVRYPNRPGALFDSMVKTITGFSIAGVIWYQGESDTDKPMLYEKLFATTIRCWREAWDNPYLPFLFVQLPSFNEASGESWGLLRESQSRVQENTPNTGMVIALDCGDPDRIHPFNKKTIGERLFRLALTDIYKK